MAKKGNVLICDDEEIMRDVLETIVSGAGYKVDLAKTGEEAIELYAERPYDVVLMDVSMPGMGGLSALEELIAIDVVGLLQERPVVGDALVEGPGILGEAQGGVRPDLLRHVR